MKTAVLIPCYNEELTIEKVVLDFKKALPQGIFMFMITIQQIILMK